MKITPGRIVLYRIHAWDLEGRTFEQTRPGDIVPLIVVRVWENEYGDGVPGVNGQLILDDGKVGTLWVTSKGEGTQNGQWFWPVKETQK